MKGTWAVVLCSLLLIAAEIQEDDILGLIQSTVKSVGTFLLISMGVGSDTLQLTYGIGRCRCIDKGSDFIQRKVLGKIEVIPKSSFCDHVEIIATMKPSGEQRCLNPNAKWVQKMVTALIKKRSSQSIHP